MTLDPTFAAWTEHGLLWLPERGMGFFPVKDEPYDRAYFEKYQGYAETEVGKELNRRRLAFVDSFIGREVRVCDVGSGCGQFVETRGFKTTVGYDVNPAGVVWLRDHWAFLDPYELPVAAATFWDALEHIKDPALLLKNVTGWAFVSIPLFENACHVLRSRHFRKDEHRWYWTRDGLIQWMEEQGFDCLAHNTMESLVGREDIHTFAFCRPPCKPQPITLEPPEGDSRP